MMMMMMMMVVVMVAVMMMVCFFSAYLPSSGASAYDLFRDTAEELGMDQRTAMGQVSSSHNR